MKHYVAKKGKKYITYHGKTNKFKDAYVYSIGDFWEEGADFESLCDMKDFHDNNVKFLEVKITLKK